MFADSTILAPLDGSPLSERSLPYAIELARVLRAKLALMIAAYISDIPEHGPWSDEMVNNPRETSMSYLTDVRARSGAGDAELIVKVGYPHEMILEVARETSASMIVLSTHGRSGMGRWLYGSTAGHLLHEASVPLFVVGKEVPEAKSPFAPKHVLVPLDGSKLGEAALPVASEVAAAFDAKITLARIAPFSAEAFPMTVPQVYWPNLDQELVDSAAAYLEKARAKINRPVETVATQGSRADELLSIVESRGVDLVTMTSHGRAGVQRALLGSTADRMLRAPVPVLLLRPQG